jgi:hypothetical protein
MKKLDTVELKSIMGMATFVLGLGACVQNALCENNEKETEETSVAKSEKKHSVYFGAGISMGNSGYETSVKHVLLRVKDSFSQSGTIASTAVHAGYEVLGNAGGISSFQMPGANKKSSGSKLNYGFSLIAGYERKLCKDWFVYVEGQIGVTSKSKKEIQSLIAGNNELALELMNKSFVSDLVVGFGKTVNGSGPGNSDLRLSFLVGGTYGSFEGKSSKEGTEIVENEQNGTIKPTIGLRGGFKMANGWSANLTIQARWSGKNKMEALYAPYGAANRDNCNETYQCDGTKKLGLSVGASLTKSL